MCACLGVVPLCIQFALFRFSFEAVGLLSCCYCPLQAFVNLFFSIALVLLHFESRVFRSLGFCLQLCLGTAFAFGFSVLPCVSTL